MLVRLACAVAAVAALALAANPAGADVAQTRVLDRTYTCQTVLGGGVYHVDVVAHPSLRTAGLPAKLPYVGLRSGNATVATSNLLAWVSAGAPAETTTLDLDFYAFDARTTGTVGVRRTLCRATRAVVPLGPKGLRGGAVPDVGREFACEVPRRVLVRVRAQLTSAAVPRGRELATVHVATRSAQITMRTTSGRPLVHGDVAASGRSRLFVAPGCRPQ